MKNKIILLVLAVAIFIPSIVAIISYNNTNAAPVSEKNVRILSVSDLSGNTFTFDKSDDSQSDMIDFFFSMNESSSKVASLPDPLVGTAFFKVTMESAQKKADYQYYFSTDASQAYYLDPDGQAYSIPKEYAASFIESRYAVSLYVNAVVPTLNVSAASVLPNTASWMYKNSAGVYVDCDTQTSSDAQKVSLEGGLELLFTLKPDHFNVKLTDTATGGVVFNDQYDKIDTLSIDKSVVLSVEIDAKWYEDSSRDYYGEMHYAFTADIAAPAEFFLAHSKRENGQFTSISALNVADLSKIQFSSTPDLGYTPVFYKDGDYAVALLPVSCDTPAGKYTLTLKYGGVSEELSLEVTQRSIRYFNYNIGTAILNATRTDATIKAFNDAMAELNKSGSATRYFDGMFVEPVVKASSYDGVITTGFGHLRKINGTDISYTHEGVDYIRSKGSEVFAGNNGVVVFAGYTELGGNTVVIEHGYGLKTWYSHLSEMKVTVGAEVKTGDAIGIVGSTGFTNQTGVHAGMSIFGVAVSPYSAWYDEPIKIVKK